MSHFGVPAGMPLARSKRLGTRPTPLEMAPPQSGLGAAKSQKPGFIGFFDREVSRSARGIAGTELSMKETPDFVGSKMAVGRGPPPCFADPQTEPRSGVERGAKRELTSPLGA